MMMEKRRPRPPGLIRLVLPLVLAALYLPLIVMVIGSFIDRSGSEAPVLTFRWYEDVFKDPLLVESLGRSLLVAGVSALIATGLGLLAALSLDRWVFAGRWPLRALSILSLMMPELILALSLLSWFSVLRMELSLSTVIFAHITLVLPFVILIIGARLKGLEKSFEDAARDLGATETQVFFQVTFPLLSPALISAFLLAFLLSFDDFLVTFYTNGAGSDTLPVRLYSLMRTGLSPKIQALSSLMLLASVLLIVVFMRVPGSGFRRRN